MARKAPSALSLFTDGIIAAAARGEWTLGVTRRPACSAACKAGKGTGPDRCAEHARQAARPKSADRARFRYAAGSRPVCTLCGLVGAFTVSADDAAYLQAGHVMPVALGGSSNPLSLREQHAACNAAAADRDLSAHYAGQDVRAWPSAERAAAWLRTPHARYVPASLPTEEQMRAARAARGLGF